MISPEQKKINKLTITASITAMLNVRFEDALELMKNLDNRIITGKTHFLDCSFQVLNGYKMYVKFLPYLDFDQSKIHNKAIEKNIKSGNKLELI